MSAKTFPNSSLLPFRQLDVRLLEKMKLNCQVFKEEISIVHLNRQVAHFKSVLQDSYDKVLLVKLTCQVSFGKTKGNQQVKLKVWSSVSSLLDCV